MTFRLCIMKLIANLYTEKLVYSSSGHPTNTDIALLSKDLFMKSNASDKLHKRISSSFVYHQSRNATRQGKDTYIKS
jgi:hypothetical protein